MIIHSTPLMKEIVNDRMTRFFVIAAGRRFGKTVLALVWLLAGDITPEDRRWFIAPTYRQGKMIAWRFLKMMVYDLKCKISESELTVILENGAEIAIKGADKADSLRGAGLNRVVMEEYAYQKETVWGLIIYPMLTSTGGLALFIGTPAGYNHFYNVFMKNGSGGWRSWQMTTLEGGNVPAEEIEKARQELDERTFNQEFNATFESYEGRLYYTFDKDKNVTDAEYVQGQPIYLSCDFNKSPMCWVVGQVEGKNLKIVDEIVIPIKAKTEHAAMVFSERYAKTQTRGQVIYLGGDAANNYESIRDVTTDYIIIKNVLEKYGFRIVMQVQKSNPNINNRVNIACSMFHHGRIKINKKCLFLIRDLSRNESDGKGAKDKSDPNQTHASDAFDYLIWVLFANEFYRNKG